MRAFLLAAMAVLSACGSATETASFDDSKADKWTGRYRLESASLSGVDTPITSGTCELSLTYIDNIRYDQQIAFDCVVGSVPMAQRGNIQVSIADSGNVTLLTSLDPNAVPDPTIKKTITVSPTYYNIIMTQGNASAIWRFKKL